MIPDCSFDAACLNLSAPPIAKPNICAFVNCGEGGVCKPDDSGMFSYSCECQPGYTNLINKTALPCAKNCFSGNSCSGLGVGLGTAPPPSPAPSGDHGSPPPSGSGTKGSASSPSLLLLLLLISIAMVVQVL
ncbi:hypothetical protein BS78_01G229900 [Paspalum vaginatum]|nr:hypothetical protein BS78_01G229900 [Paspalum vaginatum]